MVIKENRGITIIALVITIVLLLLLAGVGIYGGTQSLKESTDKKASIELNLVQHAVLETYTKYLTTSKVIEDTSSLAGTRLTDENAESNYIVKVDNKYYFKYDTDANKIELKDIIISNYYLVSTEQEFKKLGINNCKDKYVVNYTTGEVMNITKSKNSSNQSLYITSTSNQKEYDYVKSGLILHLDAINNTGNGHSSSATTWKDLSGRGNDAILHGFNDKGANIWNDNYLQFDGVDDYAVTSKELQFNDTKQFTLEFIDLNGELSKNNQNVPQVLFETTENYNLTTRAFYVSLNDFEKNDLSLGTRWNGYYYVEGTKSNILGNQGINTYTIVFNTERESKEFVSIYKNGNLLENRNSEENKYDCTNESLKDFELYIAARAGTDFFTKSDMGALRIYNRELTQREIINNYAVDKTRFGL